jgi:hypothetical protein
MYYVYIISYHLQVTLASRNGAEKMFDSNESHFK